jgi:dUTP pyrophosphatase
MTEEKKVYFAKVHPDAKIPSKRYGDAGYDVYPCFDKDYMTIPSNTVQMIPTGIASCCFPSYYLNFKHERGSTAKIGLMTAAGVVDSSYRGEIFVSVYNPTNTKIRIAKGISVVKELHDSYGCILISYPYDKAISQFTIDHVPEMNIEEISYEELKKIPSERGLGKLGSSNK